MARPRKSRGFTLVELLVVITIIGMLVSLLLPAIQAAREAGRRNTCQNNMRNCTLGLIQFAESRQAYPGYVNSIPTGITAAPYVRASWVVPILPQLERNDLYQNWQNVGKILTAAQMSAIPENAKQSFFSPLEILQCPSNATTDPGGNPLAYTVNTGLSKSFNDASALTMYPGGNPVPTTANATRVDEDINSGVFFNHSKSDASAGAAPGAMDSNYIKINADFISTRDGTTYTMLLSENLQAGNWAVDPNSGGNSFYNSDLAVRQNTGICWFLTGNQNNSTTGAGGYHTPATATEPILLINDMSQDVTGAIQVTYNAAVLGAPTGLRFSRPSANHAGGVLTSYVGGNGRYLSEEIDYKVLTQLMTPNQKLVNIAAPGGTSVLANGSTSANPKGWDGGPNDPLYLLDESAL